MRKEGFYWIFSGNEWQVAEFWISSADGTGRWGITGYDRYLADEQIEKIDENRIINPHE